MKHKILIGIMSLFFLFNFLKYQVYATEEIVEIDTQEINEENEIINDLADENNLGIQEFFRGTMNLETPQNNSNFIKQDEDNLRIAGWAVSTDINAKVRILIDENIVESNATRFSRCDVDMLISPDYGGVSINPYAGFDVIVDISYLGIGQHILKVQEISENSDIIAENQIVINIDKKSYQGMVHLDNPQNLSIFTRPDDEKVEISGWSVSSDSEASLKLFIDNKFIKNITNRTKREDVDCLISPNYGGVEITPNSGFYEIINISDLVKGRHEVKVVEFSRYEDVISEYRTEINIKNKQYKGTIYLDTPQNISSFTRPDDIKMQVSGWAVSEDSNAFLRVLVDGKVIMHMDNREKREDIDYLISPNFGGVSSTPNAGFSELIDISNLDKGWHEIRVEEFSRYGDLICDYAIAINIVNKQYRGTMYLDSPQNISSFTRPDDIKMQISGWAVSEDSNAFLRVLVDGNVIIHMDNREKREDIDYLISPNFGGVSSTPNAGFSELIDISNLDKGLHEVRIEQFSRYGDLICDYAVAINVVNKQYKGTMYLETPQNTPSFIRPDDIQMQISGWAVSEDNQSILKIFLDNKYVKDILLRSQRVDVDAIVSPSFGGTICTPKAGFSEMIDISNLDKGWHVVKVQEISRYGDLIVEYDAGMYIENKKYNGEMCLDKPVVNTSYEYNENIIVAGWAVSEDEYATVDIYIDNAWICTGDRYYREDVVYYMNKYGAKTVNAGFGKLINCEGLSSGNHKLKVYEKSRYGEIIGGIEVSIIIKSKPIVLNTQTENDNNNDNNIPQVNIATNGTKGIDVSQHQGIIDWSKVANSGVKFAMIRIGYRGYGNGGLAEDSTFKSNFNNAVSNGLKVGVYFYSAAISTLEAKKDAEYVVNILKKYGYQNKVSMPIALDLELVSGVNTRDKNLSKSLRTSIANTFCSTIAGYGYTPMVYACKSFLNDNMYASQVNYDIWVAQYNSKCTYSGKYTMWQYTSTGKVSGINGNVDCNICYKNY